MEDAPTSRKKAILKSILAIVSVFFLSALTILLTQNTLASSELAMVFAQNVGMAGSALLMWKLLYKKPFADMGFTSKGAVKGIAIGFLVGAGLISVAYAITLLFSVGDVELGSSWGIFLLEGLLISVMTGAGEETAFRGYLMGVLKPVGGTALAVIISSLLFAFVHLAAPHATALSFVNTFLLGVFLALLYLKTKALWAPIGFHVMWNYFQGYVFGLNLSGTESSSVLQSSLTSPFLSGGAYGLEGGLIVTVVSLVAIGVLLWFMRGKINTEPAVRT